MITMTGDTVIFDQLLVKGDVLILFFDEQALGRYFADIFNFMTGNTFLRAAADKGGMAGKAI